MCSIVTSSVVWRIRPLPSRSSTLALSLTTLRGEVTSRQLSHLASRVAVSPARKASRPCSSRLRISCSQSVAGSRCCVAVLTGQYSFHYMCKGGKAAGNDARVSTGVAYRQCFLRRSSGRRVVRPGGNERLLSEHHQDCARRGHGDIV